MIISLVMLLFIFMTFFLDFQCVFFFLVFDRISSLFQPNSHIFVTIISGVCVCGRYRRMIWCLFPDMDLDFLTDLRNNALRLCLCYCILVSVANVCMGALGFAVEWRAYHLSIVRSFLIVLRVVHTLLSRRPEYHKQSCYTLSSLCWFNWKLAFAL